MPVIIMPTNSGPISEEGRQALKGAFVILNAVCVLLNLWMSVYLFRKREPIFYNLFNDMGDYIGLAFFNWTIIFIDVVVLLFCLGQIVGKYL